MNRYIIITPCKNEEKNLPDLIRSLVGQSISPDLWFIVDDGSTDRTSDIIQEVKSKYNWVECIYLKKEHRDLTIHISEVMKTGFDFAKKFCEDHDIGYDFIVFLDADMVAKDAEFFEKIIAEFKKDEDLGIASGEIQYMDATGNLFDFHSRFDTISGGEMICRKECIEELGGISVSYAWDSVIRVKAILKGWKIKRFNEIKIIHTRETGSAEGLKKGYFIKGKSEYYLDLNPFIVVAKGLKYCLKRPYYTGLVYLSGYFSSLIRKKDKINDKEIRKYYYYYKPREIWQYYFNKKYRRT